MAGEKSPATFINMIAEYKSIFQECKEKNIPYLFKSICNETPSWEEFIAHINDQYHNKRIAVVPSNPYRERFIRGVLFKNPLYLNVLEPSSQWYKTIDSFFDLFNQIIPYRGFALSAYINFSKEEPSEFHFDETDNLYWQCIGETDWEFYVNKKRSFDNLEKFEKEYIKFKVSPGDVVYIPRGMMHNVKTSGPRGALQFKYNIPEIGFVF